MAVTAKKKRKKTTAKERLFKALELSYVHQSVGKNDAGDVVSVNLEFGGEAAHWPSTSNSKSAFVPKGWTRPIITHNQRHKERLKLITECYAHHLFMSGAGVPSFGERPVQILIALADNKRTDSHNMPKGICDWLAKTGFFANDKQAEAHAFKKSDYKMLFPDTTTTTVIVMDRQFSQAHYSKALEALLNETLAA